MWNWIEDEIWDHEWFFLSFPSRVNVPTEKIEFPEFKYPLRYACLSVFLNIKYYVGKSFEKSGESVYESVHPS